MKTWTAKYIFRLCRTLQGKIIDNKQIDIWQDMNKKIRKKKVAENSKVCQTKMSTWNEAVAAQLHDDDGEISQCLLQYRKWESRYHLQALAYTNFEMIYCI